MAAIYWILPFDLSKDIFKISRVTGFSSIFILSEWTEELINLYILSLKFVDFQLKELENVLITDNGTFAVGMRAIVSNSDQFPSSVDVATVNDAKVELLHLIRHVDWGKIYLSIIRAHRLQSGSANATRNNEKEQVKLCFIYVYQYSVKTYPCNPFLTIRRKTQS